MYMHCNNNVQKPFISNMKRICTNRSYCIKAYNDNDETSNQAQTSNVYIHDVNTRSILSAPKFGGNVYFGSHVRGSYHS